MAYRVDGDNIVAYISTKTNLKKPDKLFLKKLVPEGIKKQSRQSGLKGLGS